MCSQPPDRAAAAPAAPAPAPALARITQGSGSDEALSIIPSSPTSTYVRSAVLCIGRGHYMYGNVRIVCVIETVLSIAARTAYWYETPIVSSNTIILLTLLEPQSRFGDKPLKL